MLTAIVVILYAVIVPIDFRLTFKSGGKKEKLVYFGLLAVSLFVLLLYSLGIPVPSPSVPITRVIDSIFHI